MFNQAGFFGSQPTRQTLLSVQPFKLPSALGAGSLTTGAGYYNKHCFL